MDAVTIDQLIKRGDKLASDLDLLGQRVNHARNADHMDVRLADSDRTTRGADYDKKLRDACGQADAYVAEARQAAGPLEANQNRQDLIATIGRVYAAGQALAAAVKSS